MNEIQAWIYINGRVAPVTLYGEIKEDTPFGRSVVEIKGMTYVITKERIIIKSEPSTVDYDKALQGMRMVCDEIGDRLKGKSYDKKKLLL